MNTDAAKADRKANIPDCLYWKYEEVGDWVEQLGYPQYRDCFINNFIDGRKLINVTMSALPNMGITDFKHITDIRCHIRELLDIPEDNCMEYNHFLDPRVLYLQLKSKSGKTYDHMAFNAFKIQNERFFK